MSAVVGTELRMSALQWRDGAVWAVAGAAALTAHLAIAAWTMRERPLPAVEPPAPAAVMIDLAPIAVAPEAVETETAQDVRDAVESEAVPTEERIEPEEAIEEVIEETVPDEVTEPASVETAELAETEPLKPVEEQPLLQQETTETLQDVEVPLPITRPLEEEVVEEEPEPLKKAGVVERKEPVKPKKKPEPRKKEEPKKAAPSKAAAKAKANAKADTRTAASQSSTGKAASISPARWQSKLLAHLERRKRYPAAAKRKRLQGTAQVRFSIDGGGNVLAVSLTRSSGFPELDKEVVSMVRRASPVPAPPPGANRTIVVPVSFTAR